MRHFPVVHLSQEMRRGKCGPDVFKQLRQPRSGFKTRWMSGGRAACLIEDHPHLARGTTGQGRKGQEGRSKGRFGGSHGLPHVRVYTVDEYTSLCPVYSHRPRWPAAQTVSSKPCAPHPLPLMEIRTHKHTQESGSRHRGHGVPARHHLWKMQKHPSVPVTKTGPKGVR